MEEIKVREAGRKGEIKSRYSNVPSNDKLVCLLRNRENLPILEELLEAESQKLAHIQRLMGEGRLNFLEIPDRAGLERLFEDIKIEVENFLGTSSIGSPSCGYNDSFEPWILAPFFIGSAFYDPNYGAIAVKSAGKSIITAPLAHEYTHFLQHMKGILHLSREAFLEGQARGVQYHVAESYRAREDNDAYLYGTVDRTVCEFKSAYFWLCRGLGIQPRESLLIVKTSIDPSYMFGHQGIPVPRAIGHSLLSIHKALHGPKVYREAMQGKYHFN